MKLYPECFGCILQQACRLLNYFDIPRKKKLQALKEVLKILYDFKDYESSPSFYASFMYHHIYQKFNFKDPYKHLKEKYDKLIMQKKTEILSIIENQKDKIYTAVKFMAIGNVIDFGVNIPVNIEDEIENINNIDFSINHYDHFIEKLKKAKSILLLADNAGEVIFDIIFLETVNKVYPDKNLILGVKGGPVINDVTVDDIKEIEIPEYIEVISNDNNYVGTILEVCSEKFKSKFNSADIIISKGQANYETLNHIKTKDIFFIFKIKCNSVAEHLKDKFGNLVLLYNKMETEN